MIENQEIKERVCRLLDNLIIITDLFTEKINEQMELSRKETEEQNTFFPLQNKQDLFLLQGEWIHPLKNGEELIRIKLFETRRRFHFQHHTMYNDGKHIRHLSHSIVDEGDEQFLPSSIKARFIFANNLSLEFNKTHSKIRFCGKIFTREKD